MLEAPTNTSTAVIVRLRSWADANGWSKSRFAREAGLVDTTLRHFRDKGWNPTREVLERLEAVIPDGWQAGDPVPAVEGDGAAAAAAASASAEEGARVSLPGMISAAEKGER